MKYYKKDDEVFAFEDDGFHDVYMKSKTGSSVLIRNSAATGSFVATVFIFAIGY